MLQVKTSLRPSPIHGMGLFAEQKIPKGTVICKYDPDIDILITKKKYSELSEIGKEFFDHNSYWSKEMGGYICAADNHRFTNHSTDPNVGPIDTKVGDDRTGIALRDIEIGEEITVDYRVFGESPEK